MVSLTKSVKGKRVTVQSDYGYSSHRRTVPGLSGLTVTGSLPFVSLGSTRIIENRVNGSLRSVTVLDATGRAVARLTGDSARY